MTDSPTPPRNSRRAVVKRHRRERQVFFFGLLLIAIAAITVIAMGVYRGTITGPFQAGFVTPEATFSATTNLACPPAGAMPLKPDEVAIRVLNGTNRQGLAGATLADLTGRGFVAASGAANWSRSYDGVARIMYGPEGLQKAYTVALQFPESQLILDTRKNAVVDVVLGSKYVKLRDPLDPALDENVPLAANAPCLPVGLIEPEPAPRIYPKDPLAPSASPSPSPSPSASS